MKTIQIPYYNGFLPLHIEEERMRALVYPGKPPKTILSQEEIVTQALENPIGTPRLSALAVEKKRVVIVTSDHTRAVPSRITLPLILKEIRKGNPQADITILIATGLHRPTTKEEQKKMFGDAIVQHEKILVNDSSCEDQFRRVCSLPSGAELYVNTVALDCDLLITEGFIEPHFFAGFSGGRKSILPGICNAETVRENHSYKAIAHPLAVAGVTNGNPIHEDMVAAARAVHVQFILNVALDENKNISAAFAGDLEKAHEAGMEYVSSFARQPVVKCDISITSNGGYPLDQNLYQSPKAISTAQAYTKENGVIIMCCSCSDGMGGTYFEKIITMGTPDEIEEYLQTIPPKETIPEQWCAQIYARILKKYTVILVSTFLTFEEIKNANMIPATTVDEALQMAYSIKGQQATVAVIPDGVSVLAVE